jgi:glycosyltransferase involved in cell wall biosynthesis
VKVAVVVQRYGADINGGAEQHARYIAEHLAPHVQVEVLTTCAHHDYISWKNELPEGVENVHGVPVRRFKNSIERNPIEFAKWSGKVFTEIHSVNDELAWLEAEGPTSPGLINYIKQHEADYDFFIFFSVRYPHAYFGARAVPKKAIIVPTAERDSALGLGIYPPLFRGVRALMYNSFEERATIHGVSKNESVPGVVVGVGSEIPERSNAGRFRQKFGIRDRFMIYVGRIDENKGCAELFNFFEHYSASLVEGLHLVLIGAPIIPILDHPRVHHLGFVDDQDKYDAMAAAELLVMPSYLESLSMVALEAWAMGTPVLANAKCEVLQGQCIRSNAGLYYQNFQEFAETLKAIDWNPGLQASLGRNGRAFFERHYAWPVVIKKYTDMLAQLQAEIPTRTMEPLPGWFGKRRRVLPPADEIVKGLPKGPYKEPLPGSQKPVASSQRPIASSQKPEASGQGPRFQSRPDQRDQQRRPRPDDRRPQQQQQQRRDNRPQGQRPQGPRPQGQGPQGQGPQGQGPQASSPKPSPSAKAPGDKPGDKQASGDQRNRDQRGRDQRGRHHRRGRRPGGGGGGGSSSGSGSGSGGGGR